MRLLKNLCFSILILLVFTQEGNSFALFGAMGIYDFTTAETRDKYPPAFTVYLGAVPISVSKMSLVCKTGLSISREKTAVAVNHERAYFYMIPFYTNIKYRLTDESSKFQPFLSAGAVLNWKIEKAHDDHEEEKITDGDDGFSFTYGYSLGAGVSLNTKKVILFVNMQYNILVPSRINDNNQSGIISTAGIAIPFGKKKVF